MAAGVDGTDGRIVQHGRHKTNVKKNNPEMQHDSTTITTTTTTTTTTSMLTRNMVSGGRARQAREVLDEESYQETLTHIVKRDYFPAVASLQRDVALLERRCVGDVTGAVALRRAARRVETQEEAAAAQDALEEGAGGRRKRPRPLSRESISGFHERVTSEDNEAFERNQREALERQRRVMARIYAGPDRQKKEMAEETSTARNKASSVWVETPLLMASDDYQATSTTGAPLRITGGEEKDTTRSANKARSDVTKNSLFFAPHATLAHGKGRSDSTQPTLTAGLWTETAAAGATGTEATTTTAATTTQDSLLMPPPAAIPIGSSSSKESREAEEQKQEEGEEEEEGEEKEASLSSLVEYIPKSTLPVKIQPLQTRLPFQQSSMLCLGGATEDTGEQDPEASSSCYDSDISTDLDAPLPSLAAERQARARATTTTSSYDFVAMTPTRDELQWHHLQAGLGPVDHDNHKDNSQESFSPSFCIAQERPREVVARRAEAKVLAQTKRFQRAHPHVSSKTPTVPRRSSSSSSSSVAQTPLGRALLGQASSMQRWSSAARCSNSFGSALRTSYTPLLSSSSLSLRKRNGDGAMATGSQTPRRGDVTRRKTKGSSHSF